MKEYISVITISFGGYNYEAENEEEYIEKVKETFAEEYNIWLSGKEISNIEEVTDA